MNAPSPAPCPPEWLDGLDALAAQAIGLSDPNPRVACRLVTRNGQVFEGHTQAAGGAHAEVVALRAAQASGADLRGATALVTLEPCSHHGRTPPCCDALIAAQVGRVVVALPDPNPLVGGQGLARLRAAGIDVHLLDPQHPLAVASRELNIGFLSRMERGRPWVRLKIAASLDGTTALANGVSQWITSEAARTDGHAWRRRASAVLTGIGTVLEDDPRLDVRLVPTPRQPLRVVVDSRLEIAPAARILPPPGEVLIYTASDPPATAAQRAALAQAGATVVDCPGAPGAAGAHAKVDLAAMLADLARRGVNELHLEAGHKLNGSFLREGLVDELLLYLAPQLLGPGAGLANIGPFTELDQGPKLAFHEVTPVGPDLRVRARFLR
ncbi:bifunctional diaminohydroxyphosphoribosylaminopyrimidine deaminase/5-amino-6-(5-phosphoribosylamino)uracil reductase RibD [Aquabacterium sp. A08]|uniref:bifunctional diaminohydroxyphosphoribosylaminopyrimidine deaminase/5-amino-6-(5-phosphoribosylamino)uracil reductase RibD n=1 Tax=Aquabacterium sp. A08 TaxID=2718532 RepID=UPI00141F3C02|nr:bifunctional diaminohydroxyphosphoribosylaminopyrimidine deaminase/5-amino-6-(5-phosphoribosylamino)uracil reductase RibD [Aquabacterium sp. A08]NIC41558.1 bifunctional diaminohydroxyphosphoribosylaminopyrimidine deaminase/5-amino-6-(5-phosphoribosylamino)uracil reductase RibD [Aquabacterium sp. A08]NIC42082.1 bifunctional diaminohydroxyphosphoribosylaminopyrimidine deaminase/5-amino-6-(5-phosphoribosylamino)uracil reductase RibD [Aquabacterium sp. A08]NIC42131.1 bifunctional diaminohydroxyph